MDYKSEVETIVFLRKIIQIQLDYLNYTVTTFGKHFGGTPLLQILISQYIQNFLGITLANYRILGKLSNERLLQLI